MTAFPLIALYATPWARAVVVVIMPHGNGGGHFRAVVTREDDQSVVCHTMFFERLHEFTHYKVHFENKIAVRAGLGFALEAVGGEGRQMHRLHGVKEKERFLGRLLGVVIQKLQAPLQENHVHFLQIKARRNHARAVVV